MHRKCRINSVAFTALIAVTATATPASGSQDTVPTLQTVLDRFVDAMGGRAAIERIMTRRVAGHFINDLPSREPPVADRSTFEAFASFPNRFRWSGHSPDGAHREGHDGTVHWRQDANGVTIAHEPMRTKTAWLLDPHNALRIEEYFPGMIVTGIQDRGGRRVYVVESDRTTTHYGLYFDVESGLLAGIGYYWDVADYHEIDGVMVPGRVLVSRKGGSSTFVFETVEHNVAADDALFAPPGDHPPFVVASGFRINVRTGPSTEHVVVGQVDKGTVFRCTGERGEWFEIRMFSDQPRFISKAHVYPLQPSEVWIPARTGVELPADDSTLHAFRGGVQWAIERAEVEASEILPATLDSARHSRLRGILQDRLVLDFFQRFGIDPIVYRELAVGR